MTPLQIAVIVITGLGALILFAGGIMMLIAAFRESPLWGLMVLIFPPIATMCFLFAHWQQAKKAFSVQVMGSSFILLSFTIATRLLAGGMEEWAKGQMATMMEEVEISEASSPLDWKLIEATTAEGSASSADPSAETTVSPDGASIGLTLKQVREQRGEPKAVMQFEGKTLYLYEDIEFISDDGLNVTGESRR